MRVFESLADKSLVAMLNGGAVGVLPTDTVYGVVCRAADEQAVKRLYGLKSRERKPGTVIAANIDQLVSLGVKYRYLKAVEQFWPNAVSVEIYHGLSYLNQRTGRQAFRLPKFKDLQKLLAKTGPLLTTSANLPDKPTASNLKEAQKYFGGKVDFYVKDGNLAGHPPSTIIRIVDDAIEIIRQGAVKINEAGKIEV